MRSTMPRMVEDRAGRDPTSHWLRRLGLAKRGLSRSWERGGRLRSSRAEQSSALPLSQPALGSKLPSCGNPLPYQGERARRVTPPFPTAPRLCHGLTTMSATTHPCPHRPDARVARRSPTCPATVASPSPTGRPPVVSLSRRRSASVARMSRNCRVGVASRSRTRREPVLSPVHTPIVVGIVRTVAS